MNIGRGNSFTVKFTGNPHKSEDIVVVILLLVGEILLVTLTNQIVAAVIVERVLGEWRCSIEFKDACWRDRISGLVASITVVDAYDQEILVSFHRNPPYILYSALRYGRYLLNLKSLYIFFEGLGLHESCLGVAEKRQKNLSYKWKALNGHAIC